MAMATVIAIATTTTATAMIVGTTIVGTTTVTNITVDPGQFGQVRFNAGAPGTYYYWGTIDAAKRRAEEGGGPVAPAGAPVEAAPDQSASAEVPSVATPEVVASAPPVSATPATTEHKPTGQADRTLMLRSTYCGVTDTGPVAGETFEQKVQRLAAVAAAAKQRADGG